MMRFIITIFAALFATSAHAQTGSQKTLAQMTSEINSLWVTSGAGQITAFTARQTLLDMITSTGTLSTANTWTGVQTISVGTLTTGLSALNVLATLPDSSGAQVGFNLNTQTTAGSNPSIMAAMNVTLGSGYVGSGDAIGILFTINTASTANIASGAGAPHGNSATQATASGPGTGANFGHTGTAKNGNMNVGTAGYAFFAKNSATNIGVLGDALNTGTTPVQIAGLFTLHGSIPAVSAAVIADNAATSSPIFLAMVAGVTKVSIDQNGVLGITPATWADNQTCTAGQIAADASFIYVCTSANTVKRATLASF